MTCSASCSLCFRSSALALVCGLGFGLSSAAAQSGADLAGYFGFDDPRVIVVDDGTGPMLSADVNGDGLMDLVVVNNRKSRIEIHTQRNERRSFTERERGFRSNELPPSEWYDRTDVPRAPEGATGSSWTSRRVRRRRHRWPG